MTVHGQTDPRFARVADALAAGFANGDDIGGAVAVVVDGQVVADLWGGWADAARSRPWAADTLVNVWSCTKGVVAAAAAQCVDRGLIRYEDRIADHWPAFAQNGKGDITLGQVMSHSAGLNGFSTPQPPDLFHDYPATIAALEAMAPNFAPGSRTVYHALTYGHLVAEVIARATGRPIADHIAQDIAAPLGVEFHLGLSAAADPRAAEIVLGPGVTDGVTFALASDFPQAWTNPTADPAVPNQRDWRAAVIPGANGHAGALALARIYGDLALPRPGLMSAAARDGMARERFRGHDVTFGDTAVWGAGMSLEDKATYGPRAGAGHFGHGGWGGALGFADPGHCVGFAYVTNHMTGAPDGVDPRRKRLIDAVYDAL
jgi:CubicO group peptidase (beta-lactamase class C family)